MMHFYTVVIELGTPEWGGQQPTQEAFGCMIRLIERRSGSQRAFALYEGQKPVYMLDEDETGALLRLLEQITVQVPWHAETGRDGNTSTLKLVGPMSHAEFDWWGRVPKGWENIGAVFDHVMSLAKRHGYAPALCG